VGENTREYVSLIILSGHSDGRCLNNPFKGGWRQKIEKDGFIKSFRYLKIREKPTNQIVLGFWKGFMGASNKGSLAVGK